MTVKELIEKLQTMDQDSLVGTVEDGCFASFDAVIPDHMKVLEQYEAESFNGVKFDSWRLTEDKKDVVVFS